MTTGDKITSIVPITVPSNSQRNEKLDKDSDNSDGIKLNKIFLSDFYFELEDPLYSVKSPPTNHVTRSIDLKSIKSLVIYEIYIYSSIQWNKM